MISWEQIKENVVREKICFRGSGLDITNEALIHSIEIIEKYIPNQRISHLRKDDFIEVTFYPWIEQLTKVKSDDNNYAAVAVITSIGNAFEAVSKISGANKLLAKLATHTSIGLYDQLMTTYYLGNFFEVAGVEQDHERVDIVALIASKKINFHVKITEQHQRARAQFEAINTLIKEVYDNPKQNTTNGQTLQLVEFNGFVPRDAPQSVWKDLWSSVNVSGRQTYTIENSTPFKVTIEFQWAESEKPRTAFITGLNAFQNNLLRISEVDKSIPPSSQDIEVLILVNQFAPEFKASAQFLNNLRLDGLLMIGVFAGTRGTHFLRSNLYMKQEYECIARTFNKSAPSKCDLI